MDLGRFWEGHALRKRCRKFFEIERPFRGWASNIDLFRSLFSRAPKAAKMRAPEMNG
jgi:hypothetical protein